VSTSFKCLISRYCKNSNIFLLLGTIMPELPEVETVCRVLRPKVVGCKIVGVDFPNNYTSVFKFSSEAECILGSLIQAVERRGKHILFHLDQGILSCHLRMTGRLLLQEPLSLKHVSLKISFENGKALWFQDIRKFGRFVWHATLEAFEKVTQLGVEPLSKAWTKECLESLLKKSSARIKGFLLDQKNIAGLGNIYVDEALWFAGIHPLTVSSTLNHQQVVLLQTGIKDILSESLARHGTTFLSFYFDDGKAGSYKEMLKVFGRTGQPCLRCETPIIKIRVCQRGTHVCPCCQKVTPC
jgi:formamidopyrimidine-DNA glycosylase